MKSTLFFVEIVAKEFNGKSEVFADKLIMVWVVEEGFLQGKKQLVVRLVLGLQHQKVLEHILIDVKI